MGEFDLIARTLARLGGRAGPGVSVASGDDAAVFAGGPWPVVTVDTLVEGTHWDPAISTLADVGAKLLAVNLSDIAAMGAAPGPFLLATSFGHEGAVAISGGLDAAVAALCQGLDEARSAHGLDPTAVVPIGGDVTRSPGPTTLTLVQFGRPHRDGRLLRRDGARPGDTLYVSGPLGAAAAGLAWLQAFGPAPGPASASDAESTPPAPPAELAALCRAHRRPRARVDLAAALAAHDAVHACLDLSDGLAGDLPHILRASSVGAAVELAAIPRAPGVDSVAAALARDPLTFCLSGGEDFELLVAAAPEGRAYLEDLGCTAVGRVVEGDALDYYDASGGAVPPATAAAFRGYEHF